MEAAQYYLKQNALFGASSRLELDQTTVLVVGCGVLLTEVGKDINLLVTVITDTMLSSMQLGLNGCEETGVVAIQ